MYNITNVTQQVGILLQNLALEGDNVLKQQKPSQSKFQEEAKQNVEEPNRNNSFNMMNQNINRINTPQNQTQMMQPTIQNPQTSQYINSSRLPNQNYNYVQIARPMANKGDDDDQIEAEEDVFFNNSSQINQPMQCAQNSNNNQYGHYEDNQQGSQSEIQNTISQDAPKTQSAFESSRKPKIPPGLYFHIICQKINLSCERSIVVLALIERLCNKAGAQKSQFYINQKESFKTSQNSQISINSMTIHRLILVSILITQKFYNDMFYGNSYLAKIGGMSLSELNNLEEVFLKTIEWQLTVEYSEYVRFKTALDQFFKKPLLPQVKNIIKDIFDTIEKLEANPQALDETQEDQDSGDRASTQDANMAESQNNIETLQILQQQYLQNVQQLIQIENALQANLAMLQDQVVNLRNDLPIETAQVLQIQSIQQLYQQTQQLTQVQQEITNQVSQFEAIGRIISQGGSIDIDPSDLQINQDMQQQLQDTQQEPQNILQHQDQMQNSMDIQQQNQQQIYQNQNQYMESDNTNNIAMQLQNQVQQPMGQISLIENQEMEQLFLLNQQIQQNEQHQQQIMFNQYNQQQNQNNFRNNSNQQH